MIVSVSSTAPTVDSADIANLVTPAQTSDILNGDRPAAGQTFTTGSNATGYVLTALTIYQTRAVSNTGGTFNLRLGTVSGSTFTQTNTDTVNKTNTGITLSNAGTDWITFTLSTPIALAANTIYGIDLVRTGGGNFIQWGENNVGTNYTGGVSYTSGPNGVGSSTLSLASSQDRLFHLDITANVIPEPATLGLLGLGGLMMVSRRRK